MSTALEVAAADHTDIHATVGTEIAAGLCLVHVTKRSPAYRIRMKDGQVMAANENGVEQVVDEGKMTRPCWKWDRDKIFDLIRENDRKIDALEAVYSVPDTSPGDRMMSMLKAPEFLARLEVLVHERRDLVAQMQQIWYSTIIPDLSAYFGEHFYQVRPLLPTPDRLWDKYDIMPVLRPLTPLTPGDLDMNSLSLSDKQAVVMSQQDVLKRLYTDRFTSLFDTVLGEVHAKCMDIVQGELDPVTGIRGRSALAGGKRKNGALREITDLLDRVMNFSQFANPEVLKQVEELRATIASTDIQDINKNKGDNIVIEAIKAQMAPLGDMVKSLWETQKARASRSMSI